MVVTIPTFRALPAEIAEEAYESLVYRKMAHSAEDLTGIVLEQMGIEPPTFHSDVRRGFVVDYPPTRSGLGGGGARVLEYIQQDLPISVYNENAILIGQEKLKCSGPRIHMASTGEIVNFRLDKNFHYSPISKTFLLAGRVG